MTSIILDDVSFAYPRGRTLLKSVSGSVRGSAGRTVVVMGSSGSGKSTLLKMLAGLLAPTGGRVAWQPENAVRAYLPQEGVLFEHLSRHDNARYFTRIAKLRGRFSERAYERAVDKLRMRAILDQERGVDLMSGGEKQRLAIVRALSIEPHGLLLDEPCNGLDNSVKYDFLTELRTLTDDLGLLVVYVTHHADEARVVADDILYLEPGTGTLPPAAFLLPLSRCLNEPPTLQAARLMHAPRLAVLPGIYEDGVFRLPPHGSVSVQYARPLPFRGRCFAAIPAGSVRLGSHGVVETQGVGRTDEPHTVRFVSVEGASTVYLPGSPRSARATFCGEAFLFDGDGRQGTRIVLGGDAAIDRVTPLEAFT